MRIAFYSTMAGLPWGGSEELWHRAAQVLIARGHEVSFSSVKWPTTPEPLERLMSLGATPYFRNRSLFGRRVRRRLEWLKLIGPRHSDWLKRTRPDLVLISLSFHTDDPQIAATCRMLGVPYAILLQAVSPYVWVPDHFVPTLRDDFTQSR